MENLGTHKTIMYFKTENEFLKIFVNIQLMGFWNFELTLFLLDF